MGKKYWIGVVVVFVGMSLISFVVHGILMTSAYMQEPFRSTMRPEAEMMGMMWIYYVVYLIQALFFTLIFLKGYEGKGISEGVKYGLYMGLLLATPMAYASYAMYPMPYTVAFQWFFYGIAEYIILGILLALVAGKKQA